VVGVGGEYGKHSGIDVGADEIGIPEGGLRAVLKGLVKLAKLPVSDFGGVNEAVDFAVVAEADGAGTDLVEVGERAVVVMELFGVDVEGAGQDSRSDP